MIFRAFKRWRRRREVIQRLVDAHESGVGNSDTGKTTRVHFPYQDGIDFSLKAMDRISPRYIGLPSDHFNKIGDGWLDK